MFVRVGHVAVHWRYIGGGVSARRWVVIIALLAILVLGAATVLLFPFFAGPSYGGPEHLKDFFLSQLALNVGRKIEAGRLEISVFPNIHLRFTDLTVRDADPSQVFLTAKKADLVVRLLPLFRGQVMGKRFAVEDPVVVLRRSADGQWNYMKVPARAPREDKTIGNPLRRLLVLEELTIKDGRFDIIDETPATGSRVLTVEGMQVAMQSSMRRQRADIQMSATIPGDEGTSSLSLTGTVTPTTAQLRIAEEDPESLIPMFQFQGRAEAKGVNLRQVVGLFDQRPIPDRLRGKLNLQGQIRLVPGVVGYDIVLSDMTAYVNKSAFAGHASLSGLMTEQPTFAFTFSSSEIEVSELLEIVPAQWIHPELPSIIEDREVRGTLEVVSATLTGMTTPARRMSVTGELRVQHGHARVTDAGTTADNVSGTVLVEPGRIRVLELSGMYGKMQVDAGKVTLSFLEAGPWLELTLNGKMAAADVVADVGLDKRFESKTLAKAWKGLQEIQGLMLVGYRLAGPITEPKQIKYLRAEFEPLDVSFRTALLPHAVTGLNGRLVISDKGTQFEAVRGFVGQTQVQIQGRITPDETNAYQDFTISTRAEAHDLMQLLPAGAFPELQPQGTIGAVVGLSGPLTTPRYKGKLDLDDAVVDIPGLGRKPRGRQAEIEFDGSIGKRSVPFLHRLDLVFPSLRIPGRGTLRLDKRFRVNATVGFGPIAVTLVPDWMRPAGLERGEVEVSLDIKGKGKKWSAWQITGWIALTNGILSTKGIETPVKDVNLRLKLVDNGAELKQLTLRILDSDVQMTGSIRNWQKKPFMTLEIESSHFDIDLLIPKRGRSPLRNFLEDLAASSRVSARAKVKRGTYRLLSLNDLTCRVTITDGVVDVDRIKATALPGQVDGHIVVRLPKRRPASVEGLVRIAGMPFQDFSSLLNFQTAPLDGDLYLSGTLRGHGRNPKGVFPTLNGRASVRMTKGRIMKDDSRPIWKILSLLNVPAMLQGKVDLEQDGLPFDEITSTVVIQNGRIATEDIMVNSPVIKMTAAGSYDLPADQMDYIVAVSPFGAYSRLLQSVPLFGMLLKGERKGLATALFRVTGSIHDPQVEYLPFRSVATGIGGLGKLAVDMLVNLVTLPKEIIAPSDGAKPNPNEAPPLPPPPPSPQPSPASPSSP